MPTAGVRLVTLLDLVNIGGDHYDHRSGRTPVRHRGCVCHHPLEHGAGGGRHCLAAAAPSTRSSPPSTNYSWMSRNRCRCKRLEVFEQYSSTKIFKIFSPSMHLNGASLQVSAVRSPAHCHPAQNRCYALPPRAPKPHNDRERARVRTDPLHHSLSPPTCSAD